MGESLFPLLQSFKNNPFKTEERVSYICYQIPSDIPLCFIILPPLPPVSNVHHTPWLGYKSTDLRSWVQHRGKVVQTNRTFYLLSHWPQQS